MSERMARECDRDHPVADRPGETAVRHVVETYMEAIHGGDTDTLARVFHPTATLIGWDEGELRRVGLERWFAFVRSIPSPRSLGVASDARIVAVDVTGTAASVKVEETYRRFRYVDYLSLLFMDDRWQVVHKCYHQFPGQFPGERDSGHGTVPERRTVKDA